MKRTATALDAVKFGMFGGSGTPGTLRYSSALRELRKQGSDTAEFERDKAKAAHCPTHGELTDPIIGILGDRVAFACPWCSGPDILAAWEKEGMRS